MNPFRWLLAFLLLLALPACNPPAGQPGLPRPNFVLIQLDDLGWDDLALHGNPYLRTPTLDRLGQQSVQFDQFYVNPVCAPTRASLLTGRHFLKTGVSHVHGGKDYLHLSERTIAEVLVSHGYATGIWGKWHSGHGPGYEPWDRGFQEAYMAHLYQHRDPEGLLNGEAVSFPGRWSSQVITDYALDFMARNRDSSFFAYLSFLTCHGKLDAPDSLITRYQAQGLSPKLSTLYAMIDLLDQQLARLFVGMSELGLDENTVVLFLSDNGPAVNNAELNEADRAIRYVNGYQGHKGNLWENGVKSPLFVRWTGTLAPHPCAALADVTDLFPTLLDLAEIDLPTDQKPLDGRSLRPLLFGEAQQRAEKRTFDYANPGWPPSDQPWTPQGVKNEYRPLLPDTLDYRRQILSARQQNFKLMLNVASYDSTPPLIRDRVLIDLATDPKEQQNVLEQYPAVAAELETELASWFGEVKGIPYAFGGPVFQLAEKEQSLPVSGAVALSPELKKTFAWVEGWTAAGASAILKLNLQRPGPYQVHLKLSQTGGQTSQWEVEAAGQTLSGQGEKIIELGSLDLPVGEMELHIRCLEPLPESVRLEKLELRAF